jgi:hypothetical protein
MSIQPRNVKPDKPAPVALARPIFTASSDIGPAFCWVDPYSGNVQVRIEPLDGFPKIETDSLGRRTLLQLGKPIWLPKFLMAGYPDDDALPDALWDVLEAIFEQDLLVEDKRYRWLVSPPVFAQAV